MKTTLAGLLALGLLVTGGCNRGTPGGPGVTSPTTTAEAPTSADPSMPAGCISDLTGDKLVDDADFSIFVVAYDALLCP